MPHRTLLIAALITLVPLAAGADDGWSGSGEAGFAATRGNADSENLNAKLQFKKDDEQWKDVFYATALRSKGEVTSTTVDNSTTPPTTVTTSNYGLTANRYEAGASAGYKLDERSYIVGALRYENDDFSSFDYQAVASIGYGYTALKNQTDELSFEIGPGYRRYRPADTVITSGDPPVTVVEQNDSKSDAVGRGLIAYKHDFTESTSLVDTLLVEAGAANTFLQNDAGLQVAMNKKLALKVGYQVRHNSDATPGTDATDQLITTNLVYNFGQ
jgi:putative salt-induced outer membrane protein